MSRKGIIWVLVAVVVIIGAVLLFGGDGSLSSKPQGHVVFALTDAAADMGTVTEVWFTVDKVELHSATDGWVTVSARNRRFNLLDLKARGQWALLAQADVPADTYDQTRLSMDSVIVVTADGKQHEAKLPSGELKIMGRFTVTEGQTSTQALDVIADQSLHLTGKGQFIFMPVVRVENRTAASVSIRDNGTASEDDDLIIGNQGTVEASATVGMDVSGEVRNNFRVPTGANLNVTGTGVIEILSGNAGNATSSGMLQIKFGSGVTASSSNSGKPGSSGANSNTNVNVGGSGGVNIGY